MRLLPRPSDWADLWTPPRRTGVIALAALVGAGAFAAVSITPLVTAIANSGDSSNAAAGAGADRFAPDLRLASDRVLGRSMFFIPSPPPPPPPPPAADRGPPPPPSRYAGPAIIAMVNGEVWFSDGRKLAVGDDDDSALAVLEIKAPWSARVRWQSAEFDVPLFDRSALTKPSDAKAPDPATPPKSDAPATDPPPRETEGSPLPPQPSTPPAEPAPTPASPQPEPSPPSPPGTSPSTNRP